MKSSRIFKLAATASLVMGMATSAWAGNNTAKVTFTGKIVDAPCSVTLATQDQTIDMGQDIGNGSLAGGNKSEPVEFQVDLRGCSFTTEKNMNVVFTPGDGTSTAVGATDNLALMNTNGSGPIANASLVLADAHEAVIKLGDTYTQALALDGTGIGASEQSLHFQAWLVGAATGTVGTGEFSSAAKVTISYL